MRRSWIGMAGVCMLAALACVSAAAVVLVPVETFQDWNNPGRWIALPKTAVPAWANWMDGGRLPEHAVLDEPASWRLPGAGDPRGTAPVSAHVHRFALDVDYDGFPSDFIYEFTARYEGSPLLRLEVERPDGLRMVLLSSSLPFSEGPAEHSGRVFSADAAVRKAAELQSDAAFALPARGEAAERIVFSGGGSREVLKGGYSFTAGLYGAGGGAPPELAESRLIVGGRAFGAMGTDDLRRDLAVGLVWGTPLALLVGTSVAVGSVAAGLAYGVYAGYRGKLTDEAMMRLNDVVYALPALPFLIILAVTVSSSIFVMIGFLMMFGWVGIAKVSRSMALQVRTRGYVEAAEMMGQRDSRVILRHVVPQLLPYALASVAISVPAAITTEAGLSFLGLGDPSFPTWGQILHDASSYGAAARGLWWWIVPPGMMIALTGLSFVFIGDALDRVANPRLRRR